MVNANMFRGTIPQLKAPQPVPYVPPVTPAPYYPPQPTQPARAPAPYDPETEKLRLLMMKILFWVVGGSALLLIVWRVILKFF